MTTTSPGKASGVGGEATIQASPEDYWQRYWQHQAAESLGSAAQVQVQRTWQGRPITDAEFRPIVDWILDQLRPGLDDVVLDLCCGNGAITHHLARRSARVLGVDFAQDLLRHVDREGHPNIELQQGDIRRCEFPADSFDRILLYAGLQYLTQGETVLLMRRLRDWLRPGGRVLIGDVPDADRMWDFFDSVSRRAAHFEQLVAGEPIIGTWFAPQWLAHLARDSGFATAEVLLQPKTLPYAHFRFELLLS
ncbi:MAG: methyltransferase domain-containing protein [Kineosporiaceae bacterium]|nr:methyltransferase domain-containing protein [Kineosporiaceae bacterium]